MLVYYTSGTTGKSFYVLSHPEVSSMYLPALEFALTRVGVKIDGGPERVFAINVCAQSSTLTYATVSTYFGGAGYVKINLNPNEWKDAQDAVKFINDLQPEIYTGDPIAFLALAKLDVKVKPKALVSSAITLMPALKADFEGHFGCPVIDVYSMNESRFIAASFDAKNYEIIPHDLYVEILDSEGNPCAPSSRGEVTLTCARNPFLPLLRYRTGDFAALNFDSEYPALIDFEGRQPIVFINTKDKLINNIDITNSLEPFPIGQFSLHQNEDKSLVFKMRGGDIDEGEISNVLLNLFGETQQLTIEPLGDDETSNGKILPYTSDLENLGFNSEIAFQ
jgi:phenylacetate-CoA ligase